MFHQTSKYLREIFKTFTEDELRTSERVLNALRIGLRERGAHKDYEITPLLEIRDLLIKAFQEGGFPRRADLEKSAVKTESVRPEQRPLTPRQRLSEQSKPRPLKLSGLHKS
jgi:hypothetical protein